MTPAFDMDRESSLDTRHLLILVGLIALSFVLHLVGMKIIADWKLNTTRVPHEAEGADEDIPPLQVTTLPKEHLDPLDIFDRPAERQGNPGDGSTVSMNGLPLDHVGDLARPPERSLTTPPPAPRAAMRSELARIPAPELPPTRNNIWVPRQKIMEVVEFRAREDMIELPRRSIPRIERVEAAPDYVPPAAVLKGERLSEHSPIPVPSRAVATPDTTPADTPVVIASPNIPVELPSDASPASVAGDFGVDPGDVDAGVPLDDRLQAQLTTQRFADEPDKVYFRLAIDRRDAAELPIAPKDLVFAQDCSRSIPNERLGFCRQALSAALSTLGPQDRFNVAGFNDSVKLLFPEWASPTPDAVAAADAFISSMKSEGETDVYSSLETLLKLRDDPRRPMIILLVTDGKATVGPTASTGLIGELSKVNDGSVSIFTLGTHANANSYLLDMLAYCNRGESRIVSTKRWDIPKEISALADSLRRPVLSDVTFNVPAASRAQMFPRQASNLYADRPLQFFGSVPADEKDVIVQVRGKSTESDCDVLLRMPVAESKPAAGGDNLRLQWARQRMYDLIGEYARTGDKSLLSEMRDLSLRLRIPIPYEDEL